MNTWKVIFAALVIYVAGIITGNFAADLTKGEQNKSQGRPTGGPRPPMMGDLVRRMESRLELSSEQKEQVKQIVESSQGRMRTLMDEMRPKFETESQSMRLEIEALLSEEQMATFDRIFEHRGKRPNRGPGGRGPGGGGPGGGRGEGRFDRGERGERGERGFRGGHNAPEHRSGERPQRPELEDSPANSEASSKGTETESAPNSPLAE